MTKRILFLALALTIAGCAETTVETIPFTPVANGCTKIESRNFFSDTVVMPCFDADRKPIGMNVASGVAAMAPAQIVTGIGGSAANATVLGIGLPLLLAKPSATNTTNITK
jgi:hypothetical protein